MRLVLAHALLCSCLLACATGSQTPTGGVGGGGSGEGGTSGPTGGAGGGVGGNGGPGCNDGVLDEGEACDGDDLGAATCETLGFASGELVCGPTCEPDTSGCVESLCDNGAIDGDEQCDGSELGAGTCVSEGFAGGALTCEAATCVFDTSACKSNLDEGFEGAALPTGFTSSGNAMWLLDTSTFQAGAKSARSGDINDYGTSSLFVTLTFDAPGSISFWHRESVETCCDPLTFYIDGVSQGYWVLDSWQQATFPVAAGTHTLEWRFTKDLSISTGADAVWVDSIVATGGYQR